MMDNNKGEESRFEYFDHTADIKFKAYGSSLEESFANAILATTNVIADYRMIEKRMKISFTINSRTKESLLFDMLEELIFYLDTEAFLTSEVNSLTIGYDEEISVFTLDAELAGDRCTNYETTGDIKAATYNDMNIEEKSDEKGRRKFTVTAVLDL